MSYYFIAYKGLKIRPAITMKHLAVEELDTVAIGAIDRDWPAISEGIDHDAVYDFEAEQWFRLGDNGRQVQAVVEKLANLVGYNYRMPDADKAGPFRNFFRYPKNLAFIGPTASAELAMDFETWDERAKALDDVSFYESYVQLRSMFKFAAGTGAVSFKCC